MAFFNLAVVVSVFVFSSAFHKAPLILNASFGVFFIHIVPALQRCHLSVFSECCFLELLARPSSIRTLLLSGLVVPFTIL